MSMEKINGSSVLQQGSLDGTRRQSAASSAAKKAAQSAAQAPAAADSPSRGDTAEISEAAHRMVDLRRAVDTGRQALAQAPEIRQQKLAEVRERLETGFYASDAVRDKVAAGVDGVLQGMRKL